MKPKTIIDKQAKKFAEKELEIKITDRFIDVIKGLGHNSDKITKEIKKAGKQFSKKLLITYSESERPERKAAPMKGKSTKAALRAEEKAKKIVIKATQKYSKGERAITNVQKYNLPEFSLPVIVDNTEPT